MLPTLKERVEAILTNPTPFDFMKKIFVGLKKKCDTCGKPAKYLFYDRMFTFSPIIGLACVRCKCDAQHPGHSGSAYEVVPIQEIPRQEFARVYGVLELSKILIQINKPRQFRNFEKNLLERYGVNVKTSEYFKQRLQKHKKKTNALYTILKYYK